MLTDVEFKRFVNNLVVENWDDTKNWSYLVAGDTTIIEHHDCALLFINYNERDIRTYVHTPHSRWELINNEQWKFDSINDLSTRFNTVIDQWVQKIDSYYNK